MPRIVMEANMSRIARRKTTAAAALIAAIAACGLVAAGAAAAPPDRLTPVVATVVAAPQQVLGSDGRRHLAYELELANLSPATVTVRSIDTLAGRRVVGRLKGRRLAAVVRPFAARTTGTKLRGGQGAIVMMAADFPRSGRLPGRLVHRVRVTMRPPDATAATTYLAAPTRVVRRPAVVVAPPLRGAGWIAANGCCTALTAHRAAVLPVNGALHVAERFAIDFVQVDPMGLMFSGPKDALSSYAFVGDEVLSATAGRVVGKVDDLPETTPGTFPVGITAAEAGGNHVVVAMGKSRYAFYAHLQPGSIGVKVGDRVEVGQPLGLLGNSGNSDAPHLHFHVMDGPSPLAANGLPYRFTRFGLQGTITNFDAFSVGGERAVIQPKGQGARAAELPLNLTVVDFG